VKTEIYYQLLRNVPVTVATSSFSMWNTGASFNPNNEGYLVNDGTGRNYGADINHREILQQRILRVILQATLMSQQYKGSVIR
jgi:hypothetical protein